MKRIDLALAAIIAVNSAAPAMAAERAQSRPVQPQLAQKADETKDSKAKAAHHKADADKDKLRSNKGGAQRGDARSDQVQDMNKKR